MAAQAGFVSLPAATYAVAGRTSESTNAHRMSASAAQYRTVSSSPSNDDMRPAYPPEGRSTGLGTSPEQLRAPGARDTQLRGPGRCQLLRLAGTAVGLARLAVRGPVTRAEAVAFAGDFPLAGLFFLAGTFVAAVGSSAALSTAAFVLSAASSTLVSAFAAALVAFAAVF